MSLRDDVLTRDNLWHSLVAATFVIILSLIAMMARFYFDAWPFIAAVLAAAGLYLREAAQVDWQWELPDKTGKPSLHKWAEALIGSAAGLLTAAVFALAT